MKVRIIIEGDSERFMARMDLAGEIAGIFARCELAQVKITRLQITSVDEPAGELIDTAQCDCAAG